MALGRLFGEAVTARPGAGDSEADRLVATHIEEVTAPAVALLKKIGRSQAPALDRVLEAEPAVQVAVLRATFFAMLDLSRRTAQVFEQYTAELDETGAHQQVGEHGWWESYHQLGAACELAVRLLNRTQVYRAFDADDIACLVRLTADCPARMLCRWPVAGVVRRIKGFVGKDPLAPELRDRLAALAQRTASAPDAETRQLTTPITALLSKSGAQLVLIASPFGSAVMASVNALDGPAKRAWLALLEHVLAAENKARPSDKWLGEAAARLAAVGAESFAEHLAAWLDEFAPDPAQPEPNADFIRGLIWATAALEAPRLEGLVGMVCEACYKKVPGVGPANVKLGNACIYALGAMAGERAAAELVRLRSRIKFNQGRKQLDKAIRATAERAGLSVQDLEEMTLPDFGLGADGSLREELGGCSAEIRIAGSDQVTLSWTGADGKPRKTVPAAVKADHAEALKELRARVKEIKGLLSAQRWRLESLYLQGRAWPLAAWRKRYLDHPLLSNLSRRLIWCFAEGGEVMLAVPVEGGLAAADGRALDWPGDSAEVSLWHPIGTPADQVLAWRRRLAELEITQPFKQAHREVYILTDAERRTDIYSNRFAAHILKQHQLNALCQARAWHYGLRGAWDQPEFVPTRHLPHCRLKAELWLDPVGFEQHTEAGVYLYVGTDQVRFQDEQDQAVHLDEVPPLVFSEVMRDVDLFVGVASVANDPSWQDGGPDGRHRDYWWAHSFGDLTESAKTRHGVLRELIPKLAIADRCALEDKFLCVRGSKRTYKVHLGSGNILMEPNGQYLCIVKGWDKAAGKQKIRLPFEGDGTLSLILSKAFLLAADDKITDKTILSQIDH